MARVYIPLRVLQNACDQSVTNHYTITQNIINAIPCGIYIPMSSIPLARSPIQFSTFPCPTLCTCVLYIKPSHRTGI